MSGLWACLVAALIAQPPLRIVINIPAYRLDVYADSVIVDSAVVAVGALRYPTPRGNFQITRIEWNPWWIPPDSKWAAKERPTPPGPDNPMGPVKLFFQPLYFLHGTPYESSLGSAASHGCVRMADDDVIRIAQRVQAAGGPAVTPDLLDQVTTDSAVTEIVRLRAPIPLEIRYERAELRGREVWVYRDVYRVATRPLAEELLVTLAMRGVDTATVDPRKVRRFVARVAATGSHMPLDSLRYAAPALPIAARARQRVFVTRP